MSEPASSALGTTPGRPMPWLRDVPMWIGLALLAVPTLASLGRQVWNQESGAHGPIVLPVAIWLIARHGARLRAEGQPGAGWVLALGVPAALALYVFGRVFDFISLEVAGLYLVGLAAMYGRFGARALLTIWFPLAFLAFLIPAPGWVMDQLTGPLKQFVSAAATQILSACGIPVAREGVTLYVAQYRLLVEDACSGMNSLVGLTAVSLLYIYLMHGSSLRYSGLLLLAVVPIAIAGNILRVMTLVLLTYFFGDEVAQGFLHVTAGLFLFAVDLALVFALDSLLSRTLPKSWRPA